jgi:hypothetical protein
VFFPRYKNTPLIANFASTLVLNHAFPVAAVLVHGARVVNDWSSRSTLPGGAGDITLVRFNFIPNFLSSPSTSPF